MDILIERARKGSIEFGSGKDWLENYAIALGCIWRRQGFDKACQYLETDLDRIWDKYVARKKSSKTQTQTDWESTQWKAFANVDMTADDKKAYSSWEATDEEVLVMLAEVTLTGHKFSITATNGGRTYVSSLTGKYSHCANAGQSLSAFGNDFWLSVRVLMYKHYVMCDGIWDSYQPEMDTDIG